MDRFLSDLKPLESGRVVIINAESKLKRRLYDMGITPGANITLRKLAPFGDPLEINLRGYALSIRRDEARCISIIQEVNHEG